MGTQTDLKDMCISPESYALPFFFCIVYGNSYWPQLTIAAFKFPLSLSCCVQGFLPFPSFLDHQSHI
jgi:hypothetical protein